MRKKGTPRTSACHAGLRTPHAPADRPGQAFTTTTAGDPEPAVEPATDCEEICTVNDDPHRHRRGSLRRGRPRKGEERPLCDAGILIMEMLKRAKDERRAGPRNPDEMAEAMKISRGRLRQILVGDIPLNDDLRRRIVVVFPELYRREDFRYRLYRVDPKFRKKSRILELKPEPPAAPSADAQQPGIGAEQPDAPATSQPPKKMGFRARARLAALQNLQEHARRREAAMRGPNLRLTRDEMKAYPVGVFRNYDEDIGGSLPTYFAARLVDFLVHMGNVQGVIGPRALAIFPRDGTEWEDLLMEDPAKITIYCQRVARVYGLSQFRVRFTTGWTTAYATDLPSLRRWIDGTGLSLIDGADAIICKINRTGEVIDLPGDQALPPELVASRMRGEH
jgi:hypothetical protein